jgi:hypothetical protein
MTSAQLKRIRWGVSATLALGVVVSVSANVLHAVDNTISQSIAAWPPLALLLTVELISLIPVHSRSLAVAPVIATAVIAGIAAWVSYLDHPRPIGPMPDPQRLQPAKAARVAAEARRRRVRHHSPSAESR